MARADTPTSPGSRFTENPSSVTQPARRTNRLEMRAASSNPFSHVERARRPVQLFVIRGVINSSDPNEEVRYRDNAGGGLSLIHISEPTRQAEISYAVFCL